MNLEKHFAVPLTTLHPKSLKESVGIRILLMSGHLEYLYFNCSLELLLSKLTVSPILTKRSHRSIMTFQLALKLQMMLKTWLKEFSRQSLKEDLLHKIFSITGSWPRLQYQKVYRAKHWEARQNWVSSRCFGQTQFKQTSFRASQKLNLQKQYF